MLKTVIGIPADKTPELQPWFHELPVQATGQQPQIKTKSAGESVRLWLPGVLPAPLHRLVPVASSEAELPDNQCPASVTHDMGHAWLPCSHYYESKPNRPRLHKSVLNPRSPDDMQVGWHTSYRGQCPLTHPMQSSQQAGKDLSPPKPQQRGNLPGRSMPCVLKNRTLLYPTKSAPTRVTSERCLGTT